jgi:Spy/CpxP family protein refolding chaperone
MFDTIMSVRLRLAAAAAALVTLALFTPRTAAQGVPDHARMQVMQAVGAPFIVFRDKALEELKLSDEQREKMSDYIRQTIMEEFIPFFESLKDEKGASREKKVNELRKDALPKLHKFLKETLKPEQLKRARQITLQHEALVLTNSEIQKELKITSEQMNTFTTITQELQRTVQPLIKQAQSGGNPQEIKAKIDQIRKEHRGKMEAVLTAEQKSQLKEILGPPFELGDEG